jgi:deazaflavin-dependent oxidoreductase (nitroreductase family)
MGPNTLLTVRGRKSGQARSAGVALVEIGGRRWVISAYGETQWVRNLRAAGEGEVLVRGRHEPVQAVELTQDEAVAFFRDVLQPYARSLPWLLRPVAWLFTRDIFADPAGTAARRPVFELLKAPVGWRRSALSGLLDRGCAAQPHSRTAEQPGSDRGCHDLL